MEWVETTGRTVREALDAALDELGVDEQDAEVVVLEEPRSGLFGLRRSEARVRARVRPTAPRPKRPQRQRRSRADGERAPETAARSDGQDAVERGPRRGSGRGTGSNAPGGPRRPSEESPSGGRRRSSAAGAAVGVAAAAAGETGSHRQRSGDPTASPGDGEGTTKAAGRRRRRRGRRSGERGELATRTDEGQEGQMSVEDQAAAAEAFVRGLVERFPVRATTEVHTEEGQVLVTVSGDDLGLLVGPRGSTLDALQELTRTVVQRRGEEHLTRVNVDVAGYRAKRAAALRDFVLRVAAEVVASGEARALEPMTSPDRKIVHDTANLVDGVETTSEGTDPHRYVIIRPAGTGGSSANGDTTEP